MPVSIWTVTASQKDASVADITATHFDENGKSDSSFTSRLKTGATGDIDKFVTLAQEKLAIDQKAITDALAFAASLEAKLNG